MSMKRVTAFFQLDDLHLEKYYSQTTCRSSPPNSMVEVHPTFDIAVYKLLNAVGDISYVRGFVVKSVGLYD